MMNYNEFLYFIELQNRLERLLTFVSCHDRNFSTYSIKIENLILDTCSFFDSLCQSHIRESTNSGTEFVAANEISNFNGKVTGDNFFNIIDYAILLERQYTISEFKINLNAYEEKYFYHSLAVVPNMGELNGYPMNPLLEFKDRKSPFWWKGFTNLKHDRIVNFTDANLKNLIYAIGATFVMLCIRHTEQIKKGRTSKDLLKVFYPLSWEFGGVTLGSGGNIVFK